MFYQRILISLAIACFVSCKSTPTTPVKNKIIAPISKIKTIKEKVKSAKNKQVLINERIEESVINYEVPEIPKEAILRNLGESKQEVIPILKDIEINDVGTLISDLKLIEDQASVKDEEIYELEEENKELKDSAFISVKKKLAYVTLLGTFLTAISIALLISGNLRGVYLGIFGLILVVSSAVSLWFLSNIVLIVISFLGLFIVGALIYYFQLISKQKVEIKNTESALKQTVESLDLIKPIINEKKKIELFDNNGPISEIQSKETKKKVAEIRGKI